MTEAGGTVVVPAGTTVSKVAYRIPSTLQVKHTRDKETGPPYHSLSFSRRSLSRVTLGMSRRYHHHHQQQQLTSHPMDMASVKVSAPVGRIMNSWKASLLPACSPPLMTLKEGTGSTS